MPGNKANNKYLFHKFEAANNREQSRSTQASRASHLHIMARELSEMGYRHLSPRNLKRKHVDALVKRWLEARLAIVTIKSRVSTMRWLVKATGRPNVIPRTNAELGIPDRSNAGRASKAFTLTAEQLERVPSPYVRVSLELEQEFGLRREEATKIKPHEADRGKPAGPAGFLVQGRQSARGPHPDGQAEGPPGKGEGAGGDDPRALAHPGEDLPQAHQNLRTADLQGGHPGSPRPAARLCAGALRRADALAVSGGRRTVRQGPENAAGTRPGQVGAGRHHEGNGSRQTQYNQPVFIEVKGG